MASRDEIRRQAESDLEAFIRLIAPKQVLGSLHCELIRWMTRQDAKPHQLILLPRDHGKSRMVAYRVVWEITRRPDIRVLYISATSDLAEKQLKFIKDILLSPIYTRYWPEMCNPDEGRREKWTLSEISVDHPKRKEEGVRDPTIFTAGLTTTITGLHCDVAVLDDVVIDENANTEEGREKVGNQCSYLSSIEGTEEQEWVVGTRYNPKDQYGKMQEMEYDVFDDDGNVVARESVYEIFERQVEDRGDGTGVFLWPRQQRYDGKWFGFDAKILAQKRAKYSSVAKFRAQYYNDPNDMSDAPIARTWFNHYDRKFLERQNGNWYLKGSKLNIYAAIDFAYSTNKKSDYTALVVLGMDYQKNIYVLDIERIKSDRISDYFELILSMHVKWDFRKLRAETTAAQKSIVKELKYTYLMDRGIALAIEESTPTRHEGTKEERLHAILEPRYSSGSVWHYEGGLCQTLEDELVLRRPPHDDIKDALASCIEICSPPMSWGQRQHDTQRKSNVIYNARFGGVSAR